MQPTFQPGEVVLAVRRSPSGPVHRDEVVVCRLPAGLSGPAGYLIKRVVALPGDEVEGVGSIPPGHVFVRGDGLHSYDSRQFGALPLSAVYGRVVAKLSSALAAPLTIGG